MKEYFSQFGDVTRLRLARNKKVCTECRYTYNLLIYYQTGASRHYAYIEMSSKSVAEIVAETMNNYLLMGHLLKCQVSDPRTRHLDHADNGHRSFLRRTFTPSFGSVPTRSSERCPVPE